jgi:CheY-like chemotaxis protein
MGRVIPHAAVQNDSPAAPAKGGASSPRWILVADDDDLVRSLWTEVLTQAGYRTTEARTGRTALDLMRVVVPDLMILDLHMPDLCGDEVLRHLKRSAVLRELPVLIVSGFLDEAPQHGFGLNIVGQLSKPVRLSDLLGSVQSALDGRAQRSPVLPTPVVPPSLRLDVPTHVAESPARRITTFETGVRTNPSLTILKRLAKAFGVPLTELLK